MRILAIRGANLASLKGNFAVELTRPPLCHLGLFAIAGPVGAGKSTLLDAMCLALFARTPRLSGRGGSPLSKDNDAVRANDPKSLVRRGAASAFAEVDFAGTDGKTWRARWSVRRARGQAFGRLQDEVLTLVDVDSGDRCGEGKEDTLERTREKLGLTFDECCRSVLLAQGGFSSFLKARPEERAELLEKITGTDLYSTLSMRAHERSRTETDALRVLEDELALLPPATELERAALVDAVALAETTRVSAQLRLESAEEARRHRARRHELAEALGAAHDALEAARSARAGSPTASRVAGLERAWALRGPARAAAEASAVVDAAQEAAARSNDDERRARALVESTRERRARADEALAQRARDLADAEPALAEAVVLDEQIARAGDDDADDALARATAERAGVDAELDNVASARAVTAGDLHRSEEVLAREPDLVALIPSWPALATDLRELAARDTELEGARAIAHAAERARDASAADLAALSEAARTSRASLDAIVNLADLDDVARTLAEAAATNMHRRALAAALDRAEQRTRDVRAALDVAVVEAATARALRADAEAVIAAALRAALTDDAPCPVCGAVDHPAARPHAGARAHDDTARNIEAATRAFDGAGDAARALERAAAADARVDESRRALGHAEVERDRVTLERRAVGDTGLDDAEIAVARGALHELRAAEAARREREAALTVDEQALALHVRVVESYAQARSERAISIERRLPSAVLRATSSEDGLQPRALFDALRPRIAGLVAHEHTATAARTALAQSEPHVRTLEQRRAACVERETAARSRAEIVHARTAALRVARARVLDGQSPQLVRSRLTSALDEARAGAADAAAAFAGADVRAVDADTRKRAAADAAVDARASAHHAALSLRRAIGAAGLDDDEVARAASLPDDALELARAALRGLDDAVARAEAVVADRAAALDAHGPTEIVARDGLGDGADLAEAARAALATATEAWATARAAVVRDDEARARALALTPGVVAQRSRALVWQKLSDVIGSADGARFRVFAQSLTLDALLVHANAQLQALAPRYRLERALRGAVPFASAPGTVPPRASRVQNDLDLVVVDRESGDEPRSVASLSGGETFLASLALALGLSALSAAKTSVESLFIDEGFSSLDPDTLEPALAALEALRATGRQIGVISHLPALVERIGAQVRVIPLGGGRSRVDISHVG